jgi:hypothetical protein
MERIRSVKVKIEVDTNKLTREDELTWGEHDEDETIDEFEDRVRERLIELTEIE